MLRSIWLGLALVCIAIGPGNGAELRRISESAAGVPGDLTSSIADISPDGRYILMWTDARNLTPDLLP